MDLTYDREHEEFRADVRKFLVDNAGKYPKPFGVNRPTEEAKAWQAKPTGPSPSTVVTTVTPVQKCPNTRRKWFGPTVLAAMAAVNARRRG